jgi:hypothetical protein
MTAAATTIGDAIVSQYQAAFSTLSVSRVYVPTWNLDLLDGQQILQIAPNGQEIDLASRGGGAIVKYKYLVALGAKVADTTTDALDPYADLLESLMDFWLDKTITGRQERAVEWELQTWPDIEQARTKSMFLGVFEITFLGTR